MLLTVKLDDLVCNTVLLEGTFMEATLVNPVVGKFTDSILDAPNKFVLLYTINYI